jgi:hypothetical protein
MDEMPSATFLNGSWFTGTSSDLYSSNYIVKAERDLTIERPNSRFAGQSFQQSAGSTPASRAAFIRSTIRNSSETHRSRHSSSRSARTSSGISRISPSMSRSSQSPSISWPCGLSSRGSAVAQGRQRRGKKNRNNRPSSVLRR